MAAIYSNAVQVLAFLGPTSDTDDAATDRIIDFLVSSEKVPEEIMSWSMENDVRSFLRQRYLDRIWVLQEVGLAKMVVLVTKMKTVY
jgi:hypothetical protein